MSLTTAHRSPVRSRNLRIATKEQLWRRPRNLIRLDRYERRAWSQQRRAILASMNMKLMKGIAATNGGSAYVAEEAPAAGEVKHLPNANSQPKRRLTRRIQSRGSRSSRHVAVPPQEITRARAVKASAGGGRRDCS